MRKLLLASSLLLGVLAGCSNPNMRGSGSDTMGAPSGTSGYDKERSAAPSSNSSDRDVEGTNRGTPDTTPTPDTPMTSPDNSTTQ